MRFCASVALLGLHDLSITPFSPYPGTELYDQLRSEGRIPDLDDDYFFSLAAYSDLTTTVSYSEYISDRALGRYRMAGIGVFYATSYLCRPWRVVAGLRHVFGTGGQRALAHEHLFVQHGAGGGLGAGAVQRPLEHAIRADAGKREQPPAQGEQAEPLAKPDFQRANRAHAAFSFVVACA